MLYLGLIPGDYIGWGICSRYLIQEVSRLTEAVVINPEYIRNYHGEVLDGKVLHTIGDHRLTKVLPVVGRENYGYTFFENLLQDQAVDSARSFDRILAGSTWCKEQLIQKGITWSDVLIQGIDPDMFYPVSAEKPGAKDYFVIFSGGKFELRKGQDLVTRSVKVLQERHSDILFVNCWHNSWAFSVNTMVQSPYVRFAPQKKWTLPHIRQFLFENGVDVSRTEILPRVSQNQLRQIYACTDIGVFPNRCEGGTNLVLMEYLGCGKPAIASFTSGHKDILTDHNSLPLRRIKPFEFVGDSGSVEGRWEEPELDDIIDALEYAYQNPAKTRRLGEQAGKDMKQLTWTHSAHNLIQKMGVETIRR